MKLFQFLFVVALGGCAELFSPVPGEYMTMRTQGSAQQLKMTNDRIMGPNTEVSRIEENAYRGRWRGFVVDVRSTGELVEGMVGNGRTEVHVKEVNDTLSVQGLFGGMLSQIHLSPSAFQGTVGGCAYDLKRPREGLAYEGRRACGGSLEFASLALPATFFALPADQRSLFLMMVTAA